MLRSTQHFPKSIGCQCKKCAHNPDFISLILTMHTIVSFAFILALGVAFAQLGEDDVDYDANQICDVHKTQATKCKKDLVKCQQTKTGSTTPNPVPSSTTTTLSTTFWTTHKPRRAHHSTTTTLAPTPPTIVAFSTTHPAPITPMPFQVYADSFLPVLKTFLTHPIGIAILTAPALVSFILCLCITLCFTHKLRAQRKLIISLKKGSTRE